MRSSISQPQTKGVHYTPTSVVDYIVYQTVGRLLTDSTSVATPIRVLEPACGRGVFLLSAYQFLLDWYRQKGELTFADRRRILLDSIYGVDISPQAVATTRQELLRKLLETCDRGISHHDLPDLSHNIKCGNAVIGRGFNGTVNAPLSLPLNPFNWDDEFPEIVAAAGFDAVIGNPPYLDSEWMTQHLPEWRHYCTQHYQTATGNWDLFCVFVERSFSLCKLGGYTSLIVPNKLLSAHYAASTRHLLAVQNHLLTLRDYSQIAIFPVAVYPIVYVAQTCPPPVEARVQIEPVQADRPVYQLNYTHFTQARQPWCLPQNAEEATLVERLRSTFSPLSTIAQVMAAATVSEAYALQPFIHDCPTPDSSDLRVVNSGTIDRYYHRWGHKPMRYLAKRYLYPTVNLDQIPHLSAKRQHQATQPKLIVASMTQTLEGIADTTGSLFPGKSTSIILSSIDLFYILALLNSRLMTFYYRTVFGGDRLSGGYLRVGALQLRTLPIPTLDSTLAKSNCLRLIALAGKMHSLWAISQSPSVPRLLLQTIHTTEQQIDRLVYTLYGLTALEIAIVEAAHHRFSANCATIEE